MHVLQLKHTKLSYEEVNKLTTKLNVSLSQLPKIKINDPTLPEGSGVGDVIKVERKSEDGKPTFYYRVVSV